MLRACRTCGQPTRGRYCPKHQTPSPYSSTHYKLNRLRTLAEEFACWICGQPGQPDDPLTADHILAASAGGTSARSNLRAAHRSCNSRRARR